MKVTELVLLSVGFRSCAGLRETPPPPGTYTPTCSSSPTAHPDLSTYCSSDTVAYNSSVTYSDLQDAIDDAGSGATVYVCPGEHEVELLISKKNLTIAAASGDRTDTALSGGGAAQILSGTQTQLELYNLRFTDGYALKGGAMGLSRATVSMSCVDFSDNEATEDGGAIDIERGWLTLDTVSFTDNTAASYGGAIRMDGTYPSELEVSDSTFEGNTADYGGALALGEVAQTDFFSFSTTDFLDNTAETAGGAIHLETEGTASLRINDSNLIGNDAGDGGAVSAAGDAMQLDIWLGESSIEENTADAGAAVYVNGEPDLVDLDFYSATVGGNSSDSAVVDVSDDTIVWSYYSDWGNVGGKYDNSSADLDCDCGEFDDLEASETFLCDYSGDWLVP